VTETTSIASPSGSVSLASTSIAVAPAFSATTATSSRAAGRLHPPAGAEALQ